jgi:hypothetical protein
VRDIDIDYATYNSRQDRAVYLGENKDAIVINIFIIAITYNSPSSL